MRISNAKIRILIYRLALIILGSGLGACEFNFANKSAVIQEITRKKPGKVTYVTGEVKKSVPFIGGAAYQLQDSTGSVWVMTSGSLPIPGTTITVKGEIQQKAIKVAEKTLKEVYLVELQQLPLNSEVSAVNN
ncbi:MAG TPA: hypothetical protein ACFCUY_06280 [Xenococcaceae cyanobacterium]